MTPAASFAWKQIAWNGISVSIPAHWEVEKIGNRYLALEENARPVMELKWQRVKGRFSHHKHIRRLAGLYNKTLIQKINPCPLPSEWEQALGRFDAKGFNWRSSSMKGIGVITLCPSCRTATLIQFYRYDRAQTDETIQKILNSFRDHRRDQQVIWSVFDIRAAIPEDFALERHRFEPGRFLLTFRSRNQTVTLYRWGPAAVLLSTGDLLQFVRQMQIVPESAELKTLNSNQIEGRISSSGRWPSVLKRLMPGPSFQAFRFWHLEEKNRILGVQLADRNPVFPEFFNTLCEGYESL